MNYHKYTDATNRLISGIVKTVVSSVPYIKYLKILFYILHGFVGLQNTAVPIAVVPAFCFMDFFEAHASFPAPLTVHEQ